MGGHRSQQLPLSLLGATQLAPRRQAKSKDDNYLFSPAIFDPNKSTKGTRKKENILYLRHIVLDFEDGELKPETLAKLFPDLRMVVTNTYNHRPDKPRYRAVFFTSECMTPEVYGLIFGWIADKLEEAGYSVDRRKKTRKTSSCSNSRPSGLDWSKSVPTSLFYFPCQAKEASDSFFHDFNGDKRKILDPTTWVRNSVVQFPKVDVSRKNSQQTPPREVDQAAIERATTIWRESPKYPGEGNARFFNFAVSLRSAGMSPEEIELHLRDEARFGRSPHERRAQISSIMATLRQSFKKSA